MISTRRFFREILLLTLTLSVASTSSAADKITLQLKWQHQFQFAGYYAAIEKGYYQDEGLDVHLRTSQPAEDPTQYVLDGKAQYGVGTSELLLLHQLNEPLVVLAVIFQHSPLALVAPFLDTHQSVSYLQSLKNKSVMMESNSAELFAYFSAEGLNRNDLELLDHSSDIQDILQGKAAAMSAYITDEPFLLKEKQIPFQLFQPIMGGIDFYGDNLFTTEEEIKTHPKRVAAFRSASLKGWRYAMAHPDEIIELILTKYSDRHTEAHLRYEYEEMKKLMSLELVDVGYMHEGRWQHIADVYARQGMLAPNYDFSGFLYQADKAKVDYVIRDWTTFSIIAGIIGFFLFVIFYILNRRFSQESKWLETVFRSAPSALMILDHHGKVMRWNSQASSIFGWEEYEVTGKSIFDFLVPMPNQVNVRESISKTLSSTDSSTEQHWCYTKQGKMILCSWKNAALENSRLVAMAIDITQQKELEDKLNQMAHSDALTGVANRAMFFQKLEEAISLAKRRKEKIALLFIDLDDFKLVNDQYGHEFGDVVLCEVVQRIRVAVREADVLARIGGDEFVLILQDCATNDKAMQVAEKVLFHLERPINVSGLTVIVGGSIGISFYPDNGSKTTELVKSADRAMYDVKQKQKNGIGLASNLHKPQ